MKYRQKKLFQIIYSSHDREEQKIRDISEKRNQTYEEDVFDSIEREIERGYVIKRMKSRKKKHTGGNGKQKKEVLKRSLYNKFSVRIRAQYQKPALRGEEKNRACQGFVFQNKYK